MTLIAAEELLRRVASGDHALRICDVRWHLGRPGAGRAAYEAGHVPGAIHVDLDRDLAGPGPGRHPLPDPRAFAVRMAELGIGDDHEVVAYDDAGGAVAARLWWMLDDLGHRHVRVLDGGVPAWVAAGGELTTEVIRYPPATLRLSPQWSRVVDREALRAQLGQIVLLDARAGERYRGETEPVDPLPGHIPTARSAPASGNLGPDGRMLDPDELRSRFEALGAASGEVVTSCGSGVTAAHNALAMRLAGLAPPILYAGSYSDWSRAGDPVVVGPDPGEAPARS